MPTRLLSVWLGLVWLGLAGLTVLAWSGRLVGWSGWSDWSGAVWFGLAVLTGLACLAGLVTGLPAGPVRRLSPFGRRVGSRAGSIPTGRWQAGPSGGRMGPDAERAQEVPWGPCGASWEGEVRSGPSGSTTAAATMAMDSAHLRLASDFLVVPSSPRPSPRPRLRRRRRRRRRRPHPRLPRRRPALGVAAARAGADRASDCSGTGRERGGNISSHISSYGPKQSKALGHKNFSPRAA